VTSMQKLGKEVDSRDYWEEASQEYAAEITNDYHRHRLAVIDELIPKELYSPGRRIYDFGCGDGVHFPAFLRVDIAEEMVAIGQRNMREAGFEAELVRQGDVHSMREIPSGSLDALLSFNVLAYLSNEEDALFYQEAARALRPGGHLIVTHSNELFDLYTANDYTVEFYRRHLVTEPEHQEKLPELFSHATGAAAAVTYNIRENPLAYRHKLAAHGFDEVQQEFINRHPAPPLLLNRQEFTTTLAFLKQKRYPSTLGLAEAERWKLLFTCSTFGSRSVRRPS
jgi:SAM-dependent methyltransferase